MTEPTDAATTFERVESFDVAPEALWDAVTDPDLLAEWFGTADFDLTPGGAITVGEPGEPGERATIGVVETVAEPNSMGFVWVAPGSDRPSSVELTIDADGEGSVLRVREVLIRPRWESRPAWFAPPRASAVARA